MSGLFIPNWTAVATKAWSMWAWACAMIVMITEHLLPYIGELIPWWVSASLAFAGMVLRLVPQKSMATVVTPVVEDDEPLGI